MAETKQPITLQRAAELITDSTQEVHAPNLCSKPLVSVCLVTYNHVKFIRKALDSVYQQEAPFPFEVLIGDDCSTDGTTDLVLDYQSRYPESTRVLLAKENLGKHTGNGRLNFLRTLRACRGNYVALLEGDDYWCHPRKLQQQVEVLDREPEVKICFHEALVMDERANGSDSHLLTRTLYEVKDYYAVEDFRKCEWFMATASVIFRKDEVPNPLPPFFMTVMSGDICLYYLLLRDGGRIRMLDETMAIYRRHEKSLCAGLEQEQCHAARVLLYERLDSYYEGKRSEHFRSLCNHHRNELERLRHPLWFRGKRLIKSIPARLLRRARVLVKRLGYEKHPHDSEKPPS